MYSITEYVVRSTNLSIAVEWKVNDLTTPPDNLEYLLSYIKKTTPGEMLTWINTTWTSNTVRLCFIYFIYFITRENYDHQMIAKIIGGYREWML